MSLDECKDFILLRLVVPTKLFQLFPVLVDIVPRFRDLLFSDRLVLNRLYVIQKFL